MDNTAEEDPLLPIPSSSDGKKIPSSASTSTMSMSVESDGDERLPMLRPSNKSAVGGGGAEESDDDEVRKHLNRAKIELFGWKRGVWVNYSTLIVLVMCLDWMTLSCQVGR